MKIGFAYNLKDPALDHTDAHAEYESPGTIDAVDDALSAFGTVIRLPCDGGVVGALSAVRPDVVFNIAEGWGGRDRESFVPVLCDMLGIPYSGSDAVALGVTMDKALAKRIARDAGVDTLDFLVCGSVPGEPPPFGFPAFVKPCFDGSSRGIHRGSRVDTMDLLRERVRVIIGEYRQPALVEPYLAGRDFCVGLLGNEPPVTLTTCEVLLGREDDIPFFSWEYKRRETDRLDFAPRLPGSVIGAMEDMARTIWDALGIRDYARFDFRTGSDGAPRFLEVNALPGLSPVSGIFVRQAAASGIDYNEMIHGIIKRALAACERRP